MTGSAGERRVSTLRLPGIGHLLQWRSDGFWRELGDVQHRDEAAGMFIPGEDEWDGAATWWMVYGEQVPDVVVAGRRRRDPAPAAAERVHLRRRLVHPARLAGAALADGR
ncbi:hypothetical protein ACQP2X_48975 [Actinoplanes sp. CA-131856]